MTETLDARTETLRNPILEPTPSNPEPPRLVNHRRKPAAAIQNRQGRARMKEQDLERGERRGRALLDWSGLQAWQVMHSANWWIATAAVAAIGDARPAGRLGGALGAGTKMGDAEAERRWWSWSGGEAKPTEGVAWFASGPRLGLGWAPASTARGGSPHRPTQHWQQRGPTVCSLPAHSNAAMTQQDTSYRHREAESTVDRDIPPPAVDFFPSTCAGPT